MFGASSFARAKYNHSRVSYSPIDVSQFGQLEFENKFQR